MISNIDHGNLSSLITGLSMTIRISFFSFTIVNCADIVSPATFFILIGWSERRKIDELGKVLTVPKVSTIFNRNRAVGKKLFAEGGFALGTLNAVIAERHRLCIENCAKNTHLVDTLP